MFQTIKTKWVLYLALPLLSLVMHLHIFKKDIIGYHSWRQTQTQSTINNFVHEDFNILHPRFNDRGDGDGIVPMEFPLMQWLFACFYKAFGDHLVITRIMSFIIGLFSVFGMYRLLLNIFSNETIAVLGAWAFNFSPVFYYYTVNPLPDNLALCLAIWGLAYFFAYRKKEEKRSVFLSAFFLSLSALCKLPFVLYLAPVAIYFFVQFFKEKPKSKFVFIFFCYALLLVPVATWYVVAIPHWNGNGVLKGMFDNEVTIATAVDLLQFNLISTLPELLLNYASVLFFLAGIIFIFRNKAYRKKGFYLFATWGIVILIYFFYELNMIAKVHDYYLFPFLPLLFIIVAYGTGQLLALPRKNMRAIVLTVCCIVPVTAFIRADSRWNEAKPGFNVDLLQHKAALRTAVPDNALCIAGNDVSHFIFFYYIDKKGWAFNDDQLTAAQLGDMIRKGAKYLYCDSRKVDEDPEVQKLLKSLVATEGSIRIYALGL